MRKRYLMYIAMFIIEWRLLFRSSEYHENVFYELAKCRETPKAKLN